MYSIYGLLALKTTGGLTPKVTGSFAADNVKWKIKSQKSSHSRTSSLSSCLT